MAFFFLQLYLILTYIRPQDWVPGLVGLQLMDFTILGAGFFILARGAAAKGGMVKVPHTRWMILMFVAMVMSHVSNTYLAMAQVTFVFFLKIVILYYMVLNAADSEKKLNRTLWLITICTALIALQGIQQSQTGWGWAGQHADKLGRINWIGIFHDPNDLAIALVMATPILLAFMFRRSFPLLKVVSIVLLGYLMYALYLTNSRGGYISMMAAVYFFFVKRSKHFFSGAVVGGVLAGLVFLFGPSRLGLISSAEASAYGRLDAWYWGFQLFKSRPIFGVGYKMFTEDYPLTAHNSFMLAVAELGFFGLFCWIGLFYVCYKGLSRVQEVDAKLAILAVGLQAALMGFLAGAFFLSRTYITLPYLFCALSAALFYVSREEHPEITFKLVGKDYRKILALSVGSLVLIQIAMKSWL